MFKQHHSALGSRRAVLPLYAAYVAVVTQVFHNFELVFTAVNIQLIFD